VSWTQRLAVVLALNPALVSVQVTVGETAHSLAVFAAGSDYLLDAAGVSVRGLCLVTPGPIGDPGCTPPDPAFGQRRRRDVGGAE
jgi:hypothetical protein